MTHQPHPDRTNVTVNCAVITVSDTRSPMTDKSGQLIQSLLQAGGHSVVAYALVKDEPAQIQAQLQDLCQRADLDAVSFE